MIFQKAPNIFCLRVMACLWFTLVFSVIKRFYLGIYLRVRLSPNRIFVRNFSFRAIFYVFSLFLAVFSKLFILKFVFQAL